MVEGLLRYKNTGGTFSPVILRPWVEVRPGQPTSGLSEPTGPKNAEGFGQT